jgi:hypothetical protein
MRNIEGKSYGKPYTTRTAQKRKREALDKLKARRNSRRKAKQQLYQ